jgi:hypothetical protein
MLDLRRLKLMALDFWQESIFRLVQLIQCRYGFATTGRDNGAGPFFTLLSG